MWLSGLRTPCLGTSTCHGHGPKKMCLRNIKSSCSFFFFFFFFFLSFVFCLLRATPAAYGVSQARGLIAVYIRATAMTDPSCVCELHHSSWQRRTPNPMSEARDGTWNLMVPGWIHFHRATMGTPLFSLDFTEILSRISWPRAFGVNTTGYSLW